MNHTLIRAAIAIVALALPVRAEVLTVQASASSVTAPWTSTVSIPKFNSSTGTLTNVLITVRVNTLGNVAFENRSAVTAQATANVTGRVTATFPGGTVCTATTSVPVSVSAPAFDGVDDFGGTSGGLIANLTGTNTASATPNLTLPPNPFLGSGNLNVSLASANQSTLSVPANFGMRPGVNVGAVIEISYVYTPHPDCNGNGVSDSLDPDEDGDGIPDDCDKEPGIQSGTDTPGSLLVFPEFDHTAGSMTILTVTNTAALGTPPSGLLVVYVTSNCQKTALQLSVNPRDTVSFLSSYLSPPNSRGYVYVSATNPNGGLPWDYDHLVGSALRMTAIDAYTYGYPAIAFEGRTAPYQPTDLDADGIADLDGHEYAQAPDRLLFPRFLGSTQNRSCDLVLINLTGGTAFQAISDILIYNDNEALFSSQVQTACWGRVSLTSINGVFSQAFLASTSHNPSEVIGQPTAESGWFQLNGSSATSSSIVLPNPAILGMLIEKSTTGQAAIMPYFLGEQPNGDLLPSSASGDH